MSTANNQSSQTLAHDGFHGLPVPSPRRFLILHGWQNRRPQEHWQWRLAERLRATGDQVLYPQFPDPDLPSLPIWNNLLHAELSQLGDGERVVVAHSLAVLLWFHAAKTLEEFERVDRVLLVSPPSLGVIARYNELLTFSEIVPDKDTVLAAAPSTRLVHSDNDPYCPEGAGLAYGALDLDTDIIEGGRHLDLDAGYGEWPSMLAWCREPTTRLVGR